MTARRLWTVALAAPAALWLLATLAAPLAELVRTSFETGSVDAGFRLAPTLDNYRRTASAFGPQALRTVRYASAAAAAAILAGYPVAWFMAFRARRSRGVLLALVVVPFFTTYLIRTLAWQTILQDDGPVVGALRWTGMLAPGGRLLNTGLAVTGALAYELLPLAVLPMFVSLDRIDRSLVDAAADLYASPRRAFARVVLPQSLPGVFAASLLTFVPAAGDFVNADLLGGAGNAMIGNVVQSRFLVLLDYPAAAALSVVLVGVILAGVAAYARLLGLDRIEP